MKTLDFTVEQKEMIAIGDIYVDVDIRFVDKAMPHRDVHQQMTVDKMNSQLGLLAFDIKQTVKEKIDSIITNK